MRIAREELHPWVAAMLSSGRRVIAPMPAEDGPEYTEVSERTIESIHVGPGLARTSPKAAWFPRTETILRIQRKDGQTWDVADPELSFPSVVIFGARPCDAAAPSILAPLFGWDFHDAFFEQRLEKLAFVVLACTQPVDDACFCTSVGVDPAGEGIGDVLLTPLQDGDFLAEAHTEKGVELLALIHSAPRPEARDRRPETTKQVAEMRAKARQGISAKFDAGLVRKALTARFEDPMWEKSARACLACGTCAFVCPTCHCFDIQDQTTGSKGVRQKNWDACAFPLFTIHTSGHNPRPDQAGRWRQRISHKFRYYPEKFDRILCTGCGRCMRLCPAGMDLLDDLKQLSKPTNGSPPAAAPNSTVPGLMAKPPDQSPNIYRPYLMKVADLRDETPDVRTLRLEFVDAAEGQTFDFRVGQFGLYSAIGDGESTFCIASSSTRKGYIECTFRQAGRVTRALRRLNVGDIMGFRGPYGNSFPVEDWKGKDLLFAAGGIALPPMRSVIQYCLDKRQDYGDIVIVYGARTWSDHVYKDELAEWEKRPDLKLWLCIDWSFKDGAPVEAAAEEGWRPINMKDPGATELDPGHRRYTGFVPQLVEAARPSPAGRVAVVCGPPIMIRLTLQSLQKLGYSSENVYTTLENRMKCGIGKCGRCNVGSTYICKEGPVFTARQVEQLPKEL